MSAAEIQHATHGYNAISGKALMDKRQDDADVRQPDERPVGRSFFPRATTQTRKREGINNTHANADGNMKKLLKTICLVNGAYGDVPRCHLEKQRKKPASSRDEMKTIRG